MTIILLIVIIVFAFLLFKKNQELNKQSSEEQSKTLSEKNDYLPFEKNKFVFTQNEFSCYKNLKIIADKYNFEIFGKMRLADIVSVTEKGKDYMKYFGKIKAKHIDFVLLDKKTMQPKLLIELDDNSHDTSKRKERDEFLNKLCEKVQLPLLHIRGYSLDMLESEITKILNLENTACTPIDNSENI